MKARLPIGDETVEEYAKTLSISEYQDLWAMMDDDGHNRPKYIRGYVEWMHKQFLDGLQSEDRVMEILRGADLKKYLI